MERKGREGREGREEEREGRTGGQGGKGGREGREGTKGREGRERGVKQGILLLSCGGEELRHEARQHLGEGRRLHDGAELRDGEVQEARPAERSLL